MKNTVKFGTDGWRATPSMGLNNENIMICAQSFSDYINQKNLKNQNKILIGYDTRKDSKKYAELTYKVLESNNIEAFITSRPTPTPICSFHIKNSDKIGGVIITASHNSKDWNGFKIRSGDGLSFNEKETKIIENIVDYYSNNKDKIKYKRIIKIKKLDIIKAYLEAIRNIIDFDQLKKINKTICVDYMHGSVSGILDKILPINTRFLRGNLDHTFPNMEQPEPILKNLTPLVNDIKDNNVSVGIAFDGDGDRLGVVDENGKFQNATDVFAILSNHVLKKYKSSENIGTTVTMPTIIEEVAKKNKSKIFRTPVGFKNLAPLLEESKVIFAGEESGGYSIKNHVSDKDGILSALLYLECLATNNCKPSDLLKNIQKEFGMKSYQRIDLKFNEKDRNKVLLNLSNLHKDFSDNNSLIEVDKTDGIKFFLTNDEWFLIRESGTEPLLRIYLESPSEEQINRLKNKVLSFLEIEF